MANKVYNLSGGLYSGDAFTAFETQLAASKGGNLIASPTDYKVTAGTGMNVSIAAGSAIIGNGTNSGIRVGSDAANTVAVSAASTANPRKDAVVMYIDKSVSPSTSVTDNTDLGILKFKVVAGSPAASPNAPTASAIQSSIGAGNPYMILANITVPKSATAASGFTIEDMRVLPASLIPASAIGTDQIANASVTSSKIDWTTLKGSADMPYKVATGTHMYGTTYTVRRWGNTVQFQMSGRFKYNAPQSIASSETIPVGYRPASDVRGVGFIGGKIATCSCASDGKLFYWCTGTPSIEDEFNLCMTYYTKDNFPS